MMDPNSRRISRVQNLHVVINGSQVQVPGRGIRASNTTNPPGPRPRPQPPQNPKPTLGHTHNKPNLKITPSTKKSSKNPPKKYNLELEDPTLDKFFVKINPDPNSNLRPSPHDPENRLPKRVIIQEESMNQNEDEYQSQGQGNLDLDPDLLNMNEHHPPRPEPIRRKDLSPHSHKPPKPRRKEIPCRRDYEKPWLPNQNQSYVQARKSPLRPRALRSNKVNPTIINKSKPSKMTPSSNYAYQKHPHRNPLNEEEVLTLTPRQILESQQVPISGEETEDQGQPGSESASALASNNSSGQWTPTYIFPSENLRIPIPGGPNFLQRSSKFTKSKLRSNKTLESPPEVMDDPDLLPHPDISITSIIQQVEALKSDLSQTNIRKLSKRSMRSFREKNKPVSFLDSLRSTRKSKSSSSKKTRSRDNKVIQGQGQPIPQRQNLPGPSSSGGLGQGQYPQDPGVNMEKMSLEYIFPIGDRPLDLDLDEQDILEEVQGQMDLDPNPGIEYDDALYDEVQEIFPGLDYQLGAQRFIEIERSPPQPLPLTLPLPTHEEINRIFLDPPLFPESNGNRNSRATGTRDFQCQTTNLIFDLDLGNIEPSKFPPAETVEVGVQMALINNNIDPEGIVDNNDSDLKEWLTKDHCVTSSEDLGTNNSNGNDPEPEVNPTPPPIAPKSLAHGGTSKDIGNSQVTVNIDLDHEPLITTRDPKVAEVTNDPEAHQPIQFDARKYLDSLLNQYRGVSQLIQNTTLGLKPQIPQPPHDPVTVTIANPPLNDLTLTSISTQEKSKLPQQSIFEFQAPQEPTLFTLTPKPKPTFLAPGSNPGTGKFQNPSREVKVIVTHDYPDPPPSQTTSIEIEVNPNEIFQNVENSVPIFPIHPGSIDPNIQEFRRSKLVKGALIVLVKPNDPSPPFDLNILELQAGAEVKPSYDAHAHLDPDNNEVPHPQSQRAKVKFGDDVEPLTMESAGVDEQVDPDDTEDHRPPTPSVPDDEVEEDDEDQDEATPEPKSSLAKFLEKLNREHDGHLTDDPGPRSSGESPPIILPRITSSLEVVVSRGRETGGEIPPCHCAYCKNYRRVMMARRQFQFSRMCQRNLISQQHRSTLTRGQGHHHSGSSRLITSLAYHTHHQHAYQEDPYQGQGQSTPFNPLVEMPMPCLDVPNHILQNIRNTRNRSNRPRMTLGGGPGHIVDHPRGDRVLPFRPALEDERRMSILLSTAASGRGPRDWVSTWVDHHAGSTPQYFIPFIGVGVGVGGGAPTPPTTTAIQHQQRGPRPTILIPPTPPSTERPYRTPWNI